MGRWDEKSGAGLASATEVDGAAVVVVVVVSVVVSSVAEGGLTVRSEVDEGSSAGTWFGIATGLSTGPFPPAARAAALDEEVAPFVVVVGAEAAAAAVVVEGTVSSSQSISSSGAVVVVAAVGVEVEECSLSYCWRRATRSAFLPVCGRERALRRSSSSAFLRLE